MLCILYLKLLTITDLDTHFNKSILHRCKYQTWNGIYNSTCKIKNTTKTLLAVTCKTMTHLSDQINPKNSQALLWVEVGQLVNLYNDLFSKYKLCHWKCMAVKWVAYNWW